MRTRFSAKLQLPPDSLRNELHGWISQLSSKSPEEEGVYAQIVGEGVKFIHGPPEKRPVALTLNQYRKLLVDEGLSPPRASELKTILIYEDVASRFCEKGPEKYSVREALAAARARKNSEPKPPGNGLHNPPSAATLNQAVQAISRALDNLLAVKSDNEWSINKTAYRIEFRQETTEQELHRRNSLPELENVRQLSCPNGTSKARKAAEGKKIPRIAFLEFTPGPRAGHAIGRISRATGMRQDDVASHLLEAMALNPTLRAVLPGTSPRKATPSHATPPRIRASLTPNANRELLAIARASLLKKSELARLWLEHTPLGLPVFKEAAQSQRALHKEVVKGLDADMEAAIRAGPKQRANAGQRSAEP